MKMLKLSDKEFKIITIYMLRAVTDKVDNMQDKQVSRYRLRYRNSKKDSKGSARNKNNCNKLNAFDELINRLDMAEEELVSLKTCQQKSKLKFKRKKEKKRKAEQNIKEL